MKETSGSKSKTTRKPKGGPDHEIFLYLVLHGEFAIIDIKGAEGITVLAPAMDAHAYMAGPWLGERHVPEGTTLELRGVKPGGEPGTSAFRTAGFITFTNVTVNPDSAFMELRLPRPFAVLTGGTPVPLVGGPSAISVYGPNGVGIAPLRAGGIQIPIVPVLQYEIAPNTVPYLYDMYGMTVVPWVEAGGGVTVLPDGKTAPTYYSLHVFAELDVKPMDGAHAAMAFRMSAQLMGVDASIDPGPPTSTQARLDAPPVGPLTALETNLLLHERREAFGRLGGTQCSGTDCPPMNLHPPIPPALPHDKPFVDSASCGPTCGTSGD